MHWFENVVDKMFLIFLGQCVNLNYEIQICSLVDEFLLPPRPDLRLTIPVENLKSYQSALSKVGYRSCLLGPSNFKAAYKQSFQQTVQWLEIFRDLMLRRLIAWWIEMTLWHRNAFHTTLPVRGIHQSSVDSLHKGPVKPIFGAFVIVNLKELLNKKSKCCWFETPRWSYDVAGGPFQYPIRRLAVRSRKVSKPRDLYLELYDRSEIWQAPRLRCCRRACQISKLCDNLNYRSRDIETSRYLTIRRLIICWNGALFV